MNCVIFKKKQQTVEQLHSMSNVKWKDGYFHDETIYASLKYTKYFKYVLQHQNHNRLMVYNLIIASLWGCECV